VAGRFRFWGFRSANEILDQSVREVCGQLGVDVAYTTVMTTMDRLYRKGLLSRRKVSRAFVYRAIASRGEIEGVVAAELVEHLFQQNSSEPLPILSRLVDVVTERDRSLLNDLERLVREKQEALDRRSDR
jgi:predicted transcriptional regulator